eukprot:Pgem_evm1s637
MFYTFKIFDNNINEKPIISVKLDKWIEYDVFKKLDSNLNLNIVKKIDFLAIQFLEAIHTFQNQEKLDFDVIMPQISKNKPIFYKTEPVYSNGSFCCFTFKEQPKRYVKFPNYEVFSEWEKNLPLNEKYWCAAILKEQA